MRAITFDFGQTLAELDTELLSRRAAERDLDAPAEALERHMDAAWRAYGDAKRRGAEGQEAWSAFMSALLRLSSRAGPCDDELSRNVVDWLWSEQPQHNLWRRPVTGMFELVEELVARGERVGIVSNSEGRLSELVEEMGKRHLFHDITDSGKLGIEKPDPRIFQHAARQLGVSVEAIVHVGDAWEADVRGALAAGCRAIFFSKEPPAQPTPGVSRVFGAQELRRALLAP